MKYPDRLIFLDCDGCLTSVRDGSYFNPDPAKYRISDSIMEKLNRFCEKRGAKIVISSNWRKFDPDGEWKSPGGATFRNPMRDMIAKLGENYMCALPPERHARKSDVLAKWLASTGFSGNFAVFDDDPAENFQNTPEYGISGRFVLVDREYGITDGDLDKAEAMLYAE